ncbi:unnamed protein product [Peniophora sp. CBMAI 1063]|nr:unnamed protein product [Peniophora sp. CBMAI 1063]
MRSLAPLRSAPTFITLFLVVDAPASHMARIRTSRTSHLKPSSSKSRSKSDVLRRLRTECRHKHSDDTGSTFEYVSERLVHGTRRQLEDHHVALHLQIVGSIPTDQPLQRLPSTPPPSGIESQVDTPALEHAGRVLPSQLAQSRRSNPAELGVAVAQEQGRRARSRSIEVVVLRGVPVPAGHRGVLRIQFFTADRLPPAFITLRAGRETQCFSMGAYARQWNALELKNSDRVKILTRMIGGAPEWKLVALEELAVSAQHGGVVLACKGVVNFHSALKAYHAWACPDPGELCIVTPTPNRFSYIPGQS